MSIVTVTSRPETPIRHGFDEMQHAAHRDHVLHHIPTEESNGDIQLYLGHHLLNIVVQRRLPNDWPGERIIVAMVEQAQGLFVWAAAASRLVQGGKRRRKQLFDRSCAEKLLHDDSGDDTAVTGRR